MQDGKLKRPPLILCLAQVRFGAVLKMSTFVDDIQDFLRKHGFPRYQKQQVQQINLNPLQPGQPGFLVEQSSRWLFSSGDNRSAVILTNDFVVYETNDYDVFATFKSKAIEIVKKLKEIVDISIAERIGLRYVDLIRPAQIDPLLNSSEQSSGGRQHKASVPSQSRPSFLWRKRRRLTAK